MKIRLVLVGVALLGLTACGATPIVDDEDYESGPGVVQEKDIDPFSRTCTKVGKTQSCTTDDTDYLLRVKPNNGKETVWVDVDEETYNRYEVRSTYP